MGAGMNKIDMFFQLLRGLYGASKMATAWPTDLDLQLAKKLWADQINKHTEQELRAAITNAQEQITKGEEEFSWPNVGLILSGTRRAPSHQVFLPAPDETPEQKAARKASASSHLNNIKNLLGGVPRGTN
jgi:hypothetical protein